LDGRNKIGGQFAERLNGPREGGQIDKISCPYFQARQRQFDVHRTDVKIDQTNLLLAMPGIGPALWNDFGFQKPLDLLHPLIERSELPLSASPLQFLASR